MGQQSKGDRNRTFWANYWLGLYGTPRAWAHKGANLIHAFSLLADATPHRSFHFDVHDQVLMLAGMAIEVSLKAILVHRPTVRSVVTKHSSLLTEKEKALRKAFYSHSLSDLARAAGLRLSPAQRRTALALSQYIYWRGRYVVPTEAGLDDLIPNLEKQGLVGPTQLDVNIPAAKALLERVVRAVKKELYGERRPLWRFPASLTQPERAV
jgi:hypothetical protein